MTTDEQLDVLERLAQWGYYPCVEDVAELVSRGLARRVDKFSLARARPTALGWRMLTDLDIIESGYDKEWI